jgi:iron complex outermembrane receptor protein
MRRAVLLLALLLPVATLADARDDARRAFRQGMELIAQGHHKDGAIRLERAYAILPHPNVLYNIGLAWMDAGEPDQARDAFRRYLASNPADGAAVERLLGVLDAQATAAPSTAPSATVGGSEPDPAAPSGPNSAEPQLQDVLRRLEELAARLDRPVAAAPPVDARAPAAPEAPAQTLAAKDDDVYENVVVSASRRTTSAVDAPAAVTILSRDEIRLSGVTNLPDLLRRVPGLSILTMGAGNANLAARGFNQRISNKLLVLVDGRSVYFDFLGGTFFPTLDLDLQDIERVEVIRGPGSTLYGANAFGGVINVITEPAGGQPKGQVHVTAGSGETLLGNVRFSGSRGMLGWRGSVGYEQTDRYALEYGERSDFAPTTDDVSLAVRTVRANGGLTLRPDARTMVALEGGVAYAYDNFFAIGLFRDFWMRPLTTRARVDLRLGGLGVRAFWNHFQADAAPSWQAVGGADLRTDPRSEVLDVEAEYGGTVTLGVRHDINAGAGYRLKTISWNYLDGPHVEQHLNGFVEDRLTLHPTVAAVLGFRFDQHPLVGFTPSPRAALILKPSPRQALRISFGTAFRTPTFLESYLDLVVPSTVTAVGVRSLGNTALKPENIIAAEGGYTFEDSDYLRFDVALWYERVANLIALGNVVAPTEPLGLQGNQFIAGSSTFGNSEGAFHGAGGEAAISVFPVDGLDIRATYSFAWWGDTARRDAGEEDWRDRRHPMHTANVGATWRAPFGLDANVDLHIASAISVPERAFDADGAVIVEPCDAPAYAMLNARLGWRLLAGDRLELAVTGRNLTAWKDGGHREHCMGTPVGPRVLGSATYRF